MPRQKMKMAYIQSHLERSACFRRRKASLIKKMEELKTHCDVHCCLIIYRAEDREPTVWPCPEIADELLDRFMSVFDVERGTKSRDHENYLKERIVKTQELFAKHLRRNRELQAFRLLNELHLGKKSITNFSSGELSELLWLMEETRQEITKRMNMSQYVTAASGPSSPPPSVLNHLAPPSSPDDLEFFLPHVGFVGEDEDINVPESRSGLDKSITDASGVLAASSGMENENPQLTSSSSGVDTGAGSTDNNDVPMWDHWLFNVSHDIPKIKNSARNARNLIGQEIVATPLKAASASGVDPNNVVPGQKDTDVASCAVLYIVPARVEIEIAERGGQSSGC